MSAILEIPEIAGLDSRRGLIRIPPDLDVPLTGRVRQLIDSLEFHRLKKISQLGLVAQVYPAANHSRFEHSLGVYRLALLLLKELSRDERFNEIVRPEDAELFIATALLHDLGHWPFCHPIEDMHLPEVPRHELFANSFLLEGEVADVLRDDWHINPRDVVSLLSEKPRDPVSRLLQSMLSGPIDIDKMDYLFRDSLHAGVPYGRNFDQNRLIGSMCLNKKGDGLAVTTKGKTATELIVFARYVMFSEVYWHHCVRASTTMFQRAFRILHERLDMDFLFRAGESEMIHAMRRAAEGGPAETLLDGLFGTRRSLYKRLAEYSITDDGDIYKKLAGQSYDRLSKCGDRLASSASRRMGRFVAPHELLIDAPPREREVEFKVDIYDPKQDRYRPLAQVSPVVRALAEEQFDDYVKRVRVFAHRRVADDLLRLNDTTALLKDAVEAL